MKNKKYIISFTGRKKGAEGKIYRIKETIISDSEDNAIKKLYDNYEHIAEIKIHGKHKSYTGKGGVKEKTIYEATQNGSPTITGYTLVKKKGKEAIVKNEDGKMEVFYKSPNYAGWHLIIDGVDYEFAHSVDEKTYTGKGGVKSGSAMDGLIGLFYNVDEVSTKEVFMGMGGKKVVKKYPILNSEK